MWIGCGRWCRFQPMCPRRIRDIWRRSDCVPAWGEAVRGAWERLELRYNRILAAPQRCSPRRSEDESCRVGPYPTKGKGGPRP